MPKLRRELKTSPAPVPKVLEPYFEEGCDEPLFRHGQTPLHETAYARIAELVSTTPDEGEGTTYWTFKTLTEQISQRIRA